MATDPEQLTRGHKKKARTRRLLLDAALEVLATKGDGFSVADVIVRAGVAHGTFYNYFSDRDQLVDALVPEIVQGFAARAAASVDEPDPAVRFATISARALAVAVRAPERMQMVLRIDAVQRALLVEGPLSYLHDDLRAGHASGRFTDAPDDGTIDVVLGGLLLAARRIAEGETRPAYRRSVIRRMLQSLGVEAEEARAIAERAVASTSLTRRRRELAS